MLNMLWTAEYDPQWEEILKKNFNLKRAGFNIHNLSGQFFTEDELIENLQGIDVFLVGYDPITEKVLDACPDLKVILTVRDGPEENIDTKACEARGIPVMNSAGRCAVSVAELTWGLIMNMARPMITIANRIRQDRWTKENKQELRDIVEARAFELGGKTLGIVGMGRNGQSIAKMASGFNMEILGYDPYQSQEAMDKLNVKLVSLEDLMKNSDYVVVMARVTEESKGLISKEMISLMKKTACIVNTARAPLVDYDALIEALKNDKIRMAAIDVFKPQPIGPESPWYDLPEDKVIITNHMAGFSNERTAHQCEIAFDSFTDWVNGVVPARLYTKNVFDSPDFANKGGKLWDSKYELNK